MCKTRQQIGSDALKVYEWSADFEASTNLTKKGIIYFDYEGVWHYWQNTSNRRRVNHNVLSVGRTLTQDNQPLEHILWDFRTGENPVQMEDGMISPWIQDIER